MYFKKFAFLFSVCILPNATLCQQYLTNFCLCQLDEYLLQVRKDLIENKNPKPTPTVQQTITSTTELTSTSTTQQTTVSSTTAVSTNQSSTTLSLNDTTGNTTATVSVVSTSSPSTSTAQQPANAAKSLGVVGPNGNVVYDNSLTLANDLGVILTNSFNASLCSCGNGSIVAFNLCLQNIRNNHTGFDDITSDVSIMHLNRLLPWANDIFMESSLKSKYKRIIQIKFSNYSGFLKAHFKVFLSKRMFAPAYQVQTAFETPDVRRGVFIIQGTKYETNIEDSKCYAMKDETPPLIKPKTLMDDLRYAFILSALGIVVLLGIILCCGKNEAFYVRFW